MIRFKQDQLRHISELRQDKLRAKIEEWLGKLGYEPNREFGAPFEDVFKIIIEICKQADIERDVDISMVFLSALKQNDWLNFTNSIEFQKISEDPRTPGPDKARAIFLLSETGELYNGGLAID